MELSKEAQDWIDKIREEFKIEDSGGLLILQNIGKSYDTIKACEAEIEKDGWVILDRFDQKKAHPAANILRDAKSSMMQCLKQLGLEPDEIKDLNYEEY